MSVANGLLSGLRINGQAVDLPGSAMMEGGALAAQFAVRDASAPDAQARLDGIAREAIQRFGAGGPDATLGPGDAGVFTDGGLAFVAANEPGLSARISLNTALSSSSSDLWRWRDGLNAPGQGDVGNATLLNGLQAVIFANAPTSSSALGPADQSLIGHVLTISTDIAANRVRSSDIRDFASAQLASARQSAAADGVNTDQELQKLIELEKSYAANARVVQAVDDMLSELLRI